MSELGRGVIEMPYKSKAQRAYFHARLPELAKEWDKETPKGKKLPERVKRKKK